MLRKAAGWPTTTPTRWCGRSSPGPPSTASRWLRSARPTCSRAWRPAAGRPRRRLGRPRPVDAAREARQRGGARRPRQRRHVALARGRRRHRPRRAARRRAARPRARRPRRAGRPGRRVPRAPATRRHAPQRHQPRRPRREATRRGRAAGPGGRRARVRRRRAPTVHDRGASDVQELGYVVAAGAAYLRGSTAAGLDVDEAAALVEFRYAATDEQFPTIAKLRAARRLWARVLELSGARDGRCRCRQHAVTSRPMMSTYDPWVNMLRTTVAAFAAGVGGADAVTVLPFDSPLGRPDAFGRRIARNTSHLLIASRTWPGGRPGRRLLRRREAHRRPGRRGLGGFGRIEDGARPRRRVAADGRRAARPRSPRRKRPITGLTEFPHLARRCPSASRTAARACAATAPLRGAARRPGRRAGLPRHPRHASPPTPPAPRSPPTCSPPAASRSTPRARPTASTALLAAYDGQPVVCLAGTDPTYAEWGADRGRRAARRRCPHVIVAGKPEGLDVDDSCAMGVDALDFLHPHEGEAGMSVPKSFAGLPLAPDARVRGQAPALATSDRTGCGTAPRGSTSSRSTAPSTSRASTPSTPGRA